MAALRPRTRRRAAVVGLARMLRCPGQQQHRRVADAGVSWTLWAAAVVLFLRAGLSGVPQVGGLLLLAAVGICRRARHPFRLAARSDSALGLSVNCGRLSRRRHDSRPGK